MESGGLGGASSVDFGRICKGMRWCLEGLQKSLRRGWKGWEGVAKVIEMGLERLLGRGGLEGGQGDMSTCPSWIGTASRTRRTIEGTNVRGV